MVNLEVYSIRSSEYSVYETVVRMALASGLLLGNDENVNECKGIKDCPSIFPSEELKIKFQGKILIYYYQKLIFISNFIKYSNL